MICCCSHSYDLSSWTTQLCQVGWIQEGVHKDHNYLWGIGEVGICTGSKEVAGKPEFPHHEVIKQMVIFWLLCVGVVSMAYSEAICADIDWKMLLEWLLLGGLPSACQQQLQEMPLHRKESNIRLAGNKTVASADHTNVMVANCQEACCQLIFSQTILQKILLCLCR